jgi:hypothetical protein
MKHENLQKDVNLYDLIDMVHIPGVNPVFAALVERLKTGDLQHCIDAYKRKERTYHEELFMKHYRAGQNPPLYWFHLTQYNAWQWRITNIEPVPGNYLRRNEILPRDIIDQITRELVDPDKVITMKAVHSDLLNKTVDLQFVRYSPGHLFGTVRENPDTAEVRDNRNRFTLEENMDVAYRVFFQYVQKFPEVNKSFILWFLDQALSLLNKPGTVKNGKIPPGKIKPFSIKSIKKDKIAADRSYRHAHQDVNLYDLIRFSHVREVNRIFALKLEELKTGELGECIDTYTSRREKYFREMFTDFSRPEKKLENQGDPRLYWFDLSKFAWADWGITRIRPWPPPVEPFYIIPDDIINCIIMYHDVDPDRVITLEAVPSVLSGKKVDISFVYSSSNHLFGTIRENTGDYEYQSPGDDHDPDKEQELVYRLLFHCLYKFPEMKEVFIQVYLNNLLPVIQKHEKKLGKKKVKLKLPNKSKIERSEKTTLLR